MLYQKHQETVDEQIRRDLLFTKFASLWLHQLNNISHLFIFSAVFSVRIFLNVQKLLGGHTQNSATLQKLKAIKCRLPFFYVYMNR